MTHLQYNRFKTFENPAQIASYGHEKIEASREICLVRSAAGPLGASPHLDNTHSTLTVRGLRKFIGGEVRRILHVSIQPEQNSPAVI